MGHADLRRPLSLSVVVVTLLAGPLVAQQRPTFRSGAEIVLIDVNVIDKSHRPVGELQPADFVVTVDGRLRRVVSAQFIRYAVNTTSFIEKPTVEASAAAVRPGAGPTPSRNVLIVIDNDSIEPGDGLMAGRAAEQFLERLAPDDRVGVASIPWLRSDITMTKDRGDARSAVAAVITGNERFQPVPYNIGLAEAFAVERGDPGLMKRIVNRECKGNDAFCAEEVKMVVRQVQTQAHLRGQRSLDALRDLAEGLKHIEGPKTMVLVSGGAPTPDIRAGYDYTRVEAAFAAGQVTLYTIYIAQSQLGQVKNRLSPTFAEDAGLEREGVENATSAAGGTFMDAVGSLDQYFERVATELCGSYLIGIEVQATDRDGKPHRVQVKVSRPALEVRARRQYVIEPGKAIAANLPSGAPVTTPSRPIDSTRPGGRAVEAPGELQVVLARVIDYVAGYRRQYSNIVADEDYRQETPAAHVRLRSDFLLVKTSDAEGWVSFRDVYEVNGVAVRDRDDRLKKLFLDPTTEAAAQLRMIKEESARYNIGDVARNVNVPLFPLIFLDPAYVPCFQFRMGGRRESNGLRVWEIRYTERQRATIVRDMHTTGWFLVDAASGVIVQTSTFYTDSLNQSAEITVQYTRDPTLDMWVPEVMNEVYTGRTGTMLVKGTATYSKFRRFQVTTDEKITIRKEP